MPDLFIPEGEELDFHKEMLENRASTKGIRILPEQDPARWQDRWTDSGASDCFYRLVYCDGCGFFVGDTAYRKTGEEEADLWLMIDGDMRNAGYGAAVLKLAAEEAKKNGIRILRIVLPADHPDTGFFKKRYFRETSRTDTEIELKAETSDLLRCHCSENVCSLADHRN